MKTNGDLNLYGDHKPYVVNREKYFVMKTSGDHKPYVVNREKYFVMKTNGDHKPYYFKHTW